MTTRIALILIVVADAVLVVLGASPIYGVALLVELALLFLFIHRCYRPWYERRQARGSGSDAGTAEPRR